MSKLLTVLDVADRLQVDKITVLSYLKKGKLVGHKLAGWMWRIKEEDLEAFINGGKVQEK